MWAASHSHTACVHHAHTAPLACMRLLKDAPEGEAFLPALDYKQMNGLALEDFDEDTFDTVI